MQLEEYRRGVDKCYRVCVRIQREREKINCVITAIR